MKNKKSKKQKLSKKQLDEKINRMHEEMVQDLGSIEQVENFSRLISSTMKFFDSVIKFIEDARKGIKPSEIGRAYFRQVHLRKWKELLVREWGSEAKLNAVYDALRQSG